MLSMLVYTIAYIYLYTCRRWRDTGAFPLKPGKNCNTLSRHQIFYIRGDKSSFGEWGKLPLLLIGQSSEVSFAEKIVCLFSLIKA